MASTCSRHTPSAQMFVLASAGSGGMAHGLGGCAFDFRLSKSLKSHGIGRIQKSKNLNYTESFFLRASVRKIGRKHDATSGALQGWTSLVSRRFTEASLAFRATHTLRLSLVSVTVWTQCLAIFDAVGTPFPERDHVIALKLRSEHLLACLTPPIRAGGHDSLLCFSKTPHDRAHE